MTALPEGVQAASPPAADGLPLPQRYFAMATILAGLAVSVIDSNLVNLALPDLARELGIRPADSVWVLSAYQLATLGLLLPLARLGERYSYRRVYLVGLALFVVGSLGCAGSRQFATLVAARAVQGIGAAGMLAVNAALVRLTYPAARLGHGIALNSFVVATSSVAGPTLAAAILSVASWPWLFAVNLPLGVVVYGIGRRSLPGNPVRTDEPFAALDGILNVLSFSTLLLGCYAVASRFGAARLDLPFGWTLGLIAAGLVLGAVYVRRQLRETTPLLPLDLLRIPVFALSMCTSLCAFASQTLAFVALPFLLLASHGRSHLEAGLLIAAWPMAVVCAAPGVGRLIARFPGGLLAGLGLGTMAGGLAALAALPFDAGAVDLAVRLAICGAGFALFQSPNNYTIVTSAPVTRAGASSGMLATARLSGQALGALAAGIAFGLASIGGGEGPRAALALAAALAGLAALFSLLRLRPSAAG